MRTRRLNLEYAMKKGGDVQERSCEVFQREDVIGIGLEYATFQEYETY